MSDDYKEQKTVLKKNGHGAYDFIHSNGDKSIINIDTGDMYMKTGCDKVIESLRREGCTEYYLDKAIAALIDAATWADMKQHGTKKRDKYSPDYQTRFMQMLRSET